MKMFTVYGYQSGLFSSRASMNLDFAKYENSTWSIRFRTLTGVARLTVWIEIR